MKRLKCMPLIALGLMLMGCDQDPFGRSERKIAGDYYLQRWEDGKTYYIVTMGRSEDSTQGGGVINGTVQQVGWTARNIVAKRNPTFGGDANGWMVLRVADANIAGPYTDAELANLPEASGVKFFDAEAAWESLR